MKLAQLPVWWYEHCCTKWITVVCWDILGTRAVSSQKSKALGCTQTMPILEGNTKAPSSDSMVNWARHHFGKDTNNLQSVLYPEPKLNHILVISAFWIWNQCHKIRMHETRVQVHGYWGTGILRGCPKQTTRMAILFQSGIVTGAFKIALAD